MLQGSLEVARRSRNVAWGSYKDVIKGVGDLQANGLHWRNGVTENEDEM